MSGFLEDTKNLEDVDCECGHHEESHYCGFSGNSCKWCDCIKFKDPITGREGSRFPVRYR